MVPDTICIGVLMGREKEEEEGGRRRTLHEFGMMEGSIGSGSGSNYKGFGWLI